MPKSAGSAAPTPSAQVRAYLAALPPQARREMKLIRAAIRAAAPDAVEIFSYGIPGFKVDGRALLSYAAWKEHIGLYPVSPAIVRAHAPELADQGGAKATLKLPLDTPLPASRLTRLVKARVAEIRRR